MGAVHSESRDWLVWIHVPSMEFRDALITDVAYSRQGGHPPFAAVRMIGVVDDTAEPTLEIHIRTRMAIPAPEAEQVATQALRAHASRLDLSAVTVTVVRPMSPDEPSMR
jgi:hypothetical protein